MKLRRIIVHATAMALAGVNPEIQASPSATQYEVRIGPDGIADVTLCVRRNRKQIRFAVDTLGSRQIAKDVRRLRGAALQEGASHWVVKPWTDSDCLAYTADIGSLSHTHSDAGSRYGDAMVTDPSYWLIRPVPEEPTGSDIAVHLSNGESFSAPWHKTSQAQGITNYHIPATPNSWSTSVVIGPMTERKVDIAGGILWISDLDAKAEDAQMQKLVRWIRAAAEGVASVTGKMPVPDVRVLISPVAGASIASRFAAWLYPAAVQGGESTRGGGNSVEFEVDPRRSDEEFAQDWTAFHELSHLMHPYLGDKGSWLSEGLATYYQTVLRARTGVLAPEEAWRRMGSGFAEVARAPDGETLENVAASMEKTGRFLYVYRSGAIFWLTVDVDLRRASAGKVTLDSAMTAFRECCLPSYREWRPVEFIAQLDRLLGVHTFSQRFAEFRQMKRFPDWRNLYRQLGMKLENDKISVVSSAQDASIRGAIMVKRTD